MQIKYFLPLNNPPVSKDILHHKFLELFVIKSRLVPCTSMTRNGMNPQLLNMLESMKVSLLG